MGQYMSRTRRTRLSQLPRTTAYYATPTTMGAHTPATTHVLIAGDARAPPVTLKRSRTQDDGSEDEEGDKAQIKKRRVENTYYQVVGDLKHTSEYMFTQLFENGVGSDVCITALGHSWHLHKVLLRQSKFFDCMFSGRWADDSDSNVTLTIDDPNVDVAALSTCFASMYGDSIVITVDGLISLVASATLLQLDNVLDRCLATAKGSLDSSNVLTLYEAARMYGMTGIETLTVDYLSSRILLYAEDTHTPPINWLLGLDAALMQRLVVSSTLWVFTVELDVYSLCCMWMYAQIERDTIEEYIDKTSSDDCSKLLKGWSEEFFSSWAKENKDTAFLNSEIGQRYIPVFRALRLEHVINAIEHLDKVETDAIIPRDWVHAAVYNWW
ncbi:hypothetical protein SARC_10925, partial [Sphaeroforma arctica JP610]